jgi:multiple sugar transport system permease protein
VKFHDVKPSRAFLHAMLIIGAVAMVLPFAWMVITSLKSPAEALRMPPTWVPTEFHPDNYAKAWSAVPFARYFFNTGLVSVSVMLSVLITGSLAAYAFARMKWRGREATFLMLLGVMMVPMPVYLIPSYVILSKLPNPTFFLDGKISWIDTYWALIIPWAANVFTIFLLRQHFRTIPNDLSDAAVIDGCGRWRFLWQIVVPLSRGILVTAAIFSLIGSWNSFMWPLVVTNSTNMRVVQVGLAYFNQEAGTQWTLLMAASTFVVAPLIILFFFAQKQIIGSFARSGLKG